jgi:GNAT superfamily N-acetyltransferase
VEPVRRARAEEAPTVQALVAAAYHPYIARIGKPPGPMLDDYASRIADGQVWVLEQDGQICAILVLEEQDDGLMLDNVAVAPDWQGKGLGRVMIGFAADEARRRGFTVLLLYTHVLMTENIALYGRVGFTETHRVREKGFERVYMRLKLDD